VPSKHDSIACLSEILDNIGDIESYVSNLSRVEFEKDKCTRDAVERCLERICEAAFRLGDDAAAMMPNQPWGQIRGMGNWFRHAYDRIDLDIVWDAIWHDLPSLKSDAERALAILRAGRPRSEGEPG
jgi:uncharacterized protein with HEPN domain